MNSFPKEAAENKKRKGVLETAIQERDKRIFFLISKREKRIEKGKFVCLANNGEHQQCMNI